MTTVPATIDFTAALLDMDGKPITEPEAGPDGQPHIVEATLGRVVCTALTAAFADEQNLSGEDKVKRFALGMKVRGNAAATLTSDEITLLKKLVGKGFSPLIVGRCWELLDPASVPKEQKAFKAGSKPDDAKAA